MELMSIVPANEITTAKENLTLDLDGNGYYYCFA